jgi:single-stranded-DNA-specific exonuclease
MVGYFNMQVKKRIINQDLKNKLVNSGINKKLASILGARDIQSFDDINYDLRNLLSPHGLLDIDKAANFLFECINAQKKILIIGDYDADGATASACAVLGLRKFSANVDFLVPNRFKFGYGLTPEIVEQALLKNPDVIITVDNGIASIEGVKLARDKNIDVIVTDHHLPADTLPNANFIINPNQPNCTFHSKNLCGVGVIFYFLLSLRVIFRERGKYTKKTEPKFHDLLDLVCLGTIADLVILDYNNRILVEHGLKVIRSNNCNFGIQAIAKLSKKPLPRLKTSDLSFAIAPKLNAAGRLDDISIGIKCLLSSSYEEAESYAKQLIVLNNERREIESKMHAEALKDINLDDLSLLFTVCLYNKNWHQGVIGILASRIKEKYFRPTIIFASDESGFLKGSGRSIPGLHLRDTLDLISKRNSNLIKSFGGHAMAAGLTIREASFDLFVTIFEQTCSELLTEDDLNTVIKVDESILDNSVNFDIVRKIDMSIWGQGFIQPQYLDKFEVTEQSLIMDKHRKCKLNFNGYLYEGIFFNHSESLPDRIEAVYRVETNEFRENKKIQILLTHLI